MEKYEIEIDVTKIQKDRLVTKTYTNKDGVEVKQTLLKATVIINKDVGQMRLVDCCKLIAVVYPCVRTNCS